MKERRLCYISRTYYNQTSAGNKAKTDYEKVLHSMGAASIGLPCKIDNNKFLAFFYNLASTSSPALAFRKEMSSYCNIP